MKVPSQFRLKQITLPVTGEKTWNMDEFYEFINSEWRLKDTFKVILPKDYKVTIEIFESLCAQIKSAKCWVEFEALSPEDFNNQIYTENLVNLFRFSNRNGLLYLYYYPHQLPLFKVLRPLYRYHSLPEIMLYTLVYSKNVQILLDEKKINALIAPSFIKVLFIGAHYTHITEQFGSFIKGFKNYYPNDFEQFIIRNIKNYDYDSKIITMYDIACLLSNSASFISWPNKIPRYQILSSIYHTLLSNDQLSNTIIEKFADRFVSYLLMHKSENATIKLSPNQLTHIYQSSDRQKENCLKILTYALNCGVEFRMVDTDEEIFQYFVKGREHEKINGLINKILDADYAKQFESELSNDNYKSLEINLTAFSISQQYKIEHWFLQLYLFMNTSIGIYKSNPLSVSDAKITIDKFLASFAKLTHKANDEIKERNITIDDDIEIFKELTLKNKHKLSNQQKAINELESKKSRVFQSIQQCENKQKYHKKNEMLLDEKKQELKREFKDAYEYARKQESIISDKIDLLIDESENLESISDQKKQENKKLSNYFTQKYNNLEKRVNQQYQRTDALNDMFFIKIANKANNIVKSLSLSTYLNFNGIFSEACEGLITSHNHNNNIQKLRK